MKLSTQTIKQECFLFANKMMEMSDKKLMISFEVFDPEEMRKDLTKGEKEWKK